MSLARMCTLRALFGENDRQQRALQPKMTVCDHALVLFRAENPKMTPGSRAHVAWVTIVNHFSNAGLAR